MLTQQIALVSEIGQISASELTRVGAALQKQAVRDLGPIWEIQATVDPFVSLDDVPLGYWPIIVRDDIGTPGAAGVHQDRDGQPYALVQFSDEWSLTASHECLEMLVDPFGNRLIAGNSVKRGQGRVEYLVEVCDPSEAAQFGYTVNGILVSDFYTPHFFDPVRAAGVRYSFTGAVTSPRQVRRGGYLSWHDPISDHWFQRVFFGSRAQFRDLGVLTGRTGSLRSFIDRSTEAERARILHESAARVEARAAGAQVLAGAAAHPDEDDEEMVSLSLLPTEATVDASAARATSLREQIQALL